MEQSALSEAEIAEFGDEYVLFLHVTSKVETDEHQDLLQEKGGGGFPYLVFMDSTGGVVAEHNGPRTIDGFRETGSSASKFLALKTKAETGTPAEKVEFFMAGLGIGYFGAKDIPSKLEELKAHMSDEQLAVVSAKLIGIEVEGALNSMRSQEDMLANGKKFSEMAAAGKIPSDEEMYAPYFWYFQLEYAADIEDLKLAENVVAEIKKRFTDAQFEQLITAVDGKLEELRDSLSDDDGDDDGDDGDGQNG